jgi:dolichyl-phosphate-mannose--protein O-mannosyl transferase
MFNNSLKFILAFIIIPIIIYSLSYIPYFFIPDKDYDFGIVIENAKDMYDYHSKLVADHPFKSKWWEWPLNKRPLTFYRESNLPDNKYSAIVTMGNPAIWWVGMFTFFISLFIAVKNKDKRYLPIFIATLMQYLPWILVPRIAFIYHYFSIVPFMILSIVFCVEYLLARWSKSKPYIIWYLVLTVVLFVMFYPVLSGMEVSSDYVDYLKWCKYWYF